jgi:hypothetical protein
MRCCCSKKKMGGGGVNWGRLSSQKVPLSKKMKKKYSAGEGGVERFSGSNSIPYNRQEDQRDGNPN